MPSQPGPGSKKSNLCPTSASIEVGSPQPGGEVLWDTPLPHPRAPIATIHATHCSSQANPPCLESPVQIEVAMKEPDRQTPRSLKSLRISVPQPWVRLLRGSADTETPVAEIWAFKVFKRSFLNHQGLVHICLCSLPAPLHRAGHWWVALSGTHCRITAAMKGSLFFFGQP